MPNSPLFGESDEEAGDHWISISDMMAGLMVIFLFIAIVFIKDVLAENQRTKDIAFLWESKQEELYEKLAEEFRDDLPRWNAELHRETLAIRFREPRVLFEQGESIVKADFKDILEDFFPRYIHLLSGFKDHIDEVRIEGHTSSEWRDRVSGDVAYFANMELSQDRTRAVLEYCLLLPDVFALKEWSRSVLTANGLSSSRLILINGEEQRVLSRRVEFRVRTNADEQIRRILERAA